MNTIKKIISTIASSKKAIATIAGVLLAILSPLARKVGWDLTQSEIEWSLALIASYVVGQGIADAGKEKAKIEASEKAPASVD